MTHAALVVLAVAALCGAVRGRSAPIIGLSGDDTRHGIAVLYGEFNSANAMELTRYHLDTLVQTRFARSTLNIELKNNGADNKTATIPFAIPQSGMLVNFEIESDGKVHQARPVLRDAIQVDSNSSSASITARDAESFDVELELMEASSVILRLEYEELLTRKLQRYVNVQQVWPGGLVSDLRLTVHIKEATSINNNVNVTFTTDAAASGANINSLIYVERPSSGEVLITLQPTPIQQREIAALLNLPQEGGLAGQFEVEYDVERYPTAGDIVVHDDYFAHFFAPSDLKALPKYALFLLDVSGSMAGRKIEQLRDAMSTILGQLGPDDVFTVIEFSSGNNMWNLGVPSIGTTCNVYSSQYAAEAQQKAQSMRANGGTAMLAGLQQTVQCAAAGPVGLEPILLLLTDGVPNESLDQIQAATTAANNPTGKDGDLVTSIFTLALGDDADLAFLRELALRNGGSSKQIYVASDASVQLQDFYKSIATPLLKDVSVAFDYQQAEQGSVTQKDFRTYFWGSELVVAGRLLPGQGNMLSGTVTATGLGGQVVNYPVQVSAQPSWNPERIGGQANSERLWAFLQTSQLLDQEVVDGQGSAAGLAAMDIALQYSFVTPHTCLAVDIINPYSAPTFPPPAITTAGTLAPPTDAPTPPNPTSTPIPPTPPGPPSPDSNGSRNSVSIGSISIGSMSLNGPLIQFNLRR